MWVCGIHLSLLRHYFRCGKGSKVRFSALGFEQPKRNYVGVLYAYIVLTVLAHVSGLEDPDHDNIKVRVAFFWKGAIVGGIYSIGPLHLDRPYSCSFSYCNDTRKQIEPGFFGRWPLESQVRRAKWAGSDGQRVTTDPAHVALATRADPIFGWYSVNRILGFDCSLRMRTEYAE